MYKPRQLLALLVITSLAGCFSEPDDSEQIRQRIAEMEAAVEAGEARRFAGYLVEDFQGKDGITNRRAARAFVARQLVSQQKVRVQLGPVRVILNEQSPFYASADFEALLLGGPRLMPDSGQLYRIDTKWRKEDGDWMLVEADWERGLKSMGSE